MKHVAMGVLAALEIGALPLAAQHDTLRLRPAFRLIDRMAEQQRLQDGTPGLALALVNRDGVITVRSYGWADLARRVPVTPETRFEIGSISKSFTAIALLQEVQAGRLDLQRPIRAYLPWFSPESRWRPVTPEDLLTHTAGLPADRDDIPSGPAQAWVPRERVLGSAPGTRWAYSNIGYQVLGRLLEQLTGRSYAEVIHDRILVPLRMTRTDAEFGHDSRGDLAVGYMSRYDDRPTRSTDPLVEAPWIEYGSGDGSLVATPADLGRYLVMLLNGGRGPDGPVLSPDGFTALMRPRAATTRGEARYGFGMFLSQDGGRPVFYHSGGMLGYSSFLVGQPDLGIGVVAFVNGPGDPGVVARFALRALRAVMLDDTLPDTPPPARPYATDGAAAYAGAYPGDGGDTLRFRAAGDSLLLLTAAGPSLLLSRGNDEFLGPAPDWSLFPFRFGRDSAGRVTGVSYGGRWYRGTAWRGPTSWRVPAAWRTYVGHYRIMQPWEPDFRIVVRQGRLLWVGPEGDEEELTALPGGDFRVGPPGSAERLRFGPAVDGQVLRVTYSGMEYSRYFTE